jgi:hypothetical protein
MSRMHLVLLLALTSPFSAWGGQCRTYEFAFLRNALEPYSEDGAFDSAEFAVRRRSIALHALFVIAKCPEASMDFLAGRRTAATRWIADLPSSLGSGGIGTRGREALLAVLRRHSSRPTVRTSSAEIPRLLVEALEELRRNSTESSQVESLCRDVVSVAAEDWKFPDGYLMAAVNNMAITLVSCSSETLSFWGRDRRAFDLWIGNLDPAVFTPGSNTRDQCQLGDDIRNVAARLKKRRMAHQDTTQILEAVSEQIADCSKGVSNSRD